MISNTHILFFLISFSLFIIIVNSSNTTTSASNADSFLLTCGGSTTATDANGRKWIPDSKYLTSLENSITGTAQSQDPSLPSTIPYMTARIFTSESTYSFPISPNHRHFIRLHFYPSSYSNFNASDSYLSVESNGYTLLKNFSASITSQALTQGYIIKEFSLTSTQSPSLNITFIPMKNRSVAFVNGIEIISMSEIFQEAVMVGFSDQLIETENSVLQTMFRLNVGGQYISEEKDTKLSRIWYDDSPYLYGAAMGITSEANKNVSIHYPSNLTQYVAPIDVYRTARTMGPTPKLNIKFNLTWVFPVDLNFTYMVRLHFCEFEVSKTNQRVFDIFINNQTAQEAADVLAWSDSKVGVPVYKDFAVYVTAKPELWVALHPSVSMKPEFYDAILNGLEIFKVNDTGGNLAGPNPVPSHFQENASYDQEPRSFERSRSTNLGAIIGGVAGGVAGFCLMVGVLVCLKRNNKRDSTGRRCNSTGWLPLYGSSQSSGTKSLTPSGKSSGGSSRISMLGGGLCRHFSLLDIKHATKNFDESRVIGVGGFGKVYKGVIDGGTEVAIKRSNPSSEQGVHEFQTEIDLLSKLRHRHLVSLIGACEEDNEMILVYDYMANGTLREHIYNRNNNPPLLWKQRLEICIGAARGLHYLHTGAKHTIIHRDVKTTNILLDDKWVAKVSDFGLSKTGPTLSQTHVSTVVKGSFGYLDPEYFRRQQLTDKSDVYSYGVVLFEVLCGRPVLNASLPKEQVSLADWALNNYRKGTIDTIIDQNVKGEINPECLNKFVETAVKCLSDEGIERPSMGAVLWNLEFAMQLHDNPDGPKMVAEQKANDAFVMHTSTLMSIEEEGGEETEDSNNIPVFSQFVNPQGR